MENDVSIFTMTGSQDEISLHMKSVMDLTIAEDLRQDFIDCLSKNKTIKVMAADVERITTPCLQVLFAIKTKAARQDIDFLIPEMSEAFERALKDVGLDDQFNNSEQDV